MKERIGGAEEGGERGVEGWVLEEKQLQRERDELRGEERRGGNPSGKQRVLSDRLGLCNRMGAF